MMELEAEQKVKTEQRLQLEDAIGVVPRLKEQEERYSRTISTMSASLEDAIKAKEEAEVRCTLAEQDKIYVYQMRGGVKASPEPDTRLRDLLFDMAAIGAITPIVLIILGAMARMVVWLIRPADYEKPQSQLHKNKACAGRPGTRLLVISRQVSPPVPPASSRQRVAHLARLPPSDRSETGSTF